MQGKGLISYLDDCRFVSQDKYGSAVASFKAAASKQSPQPVAPHGGDKVTQQ